MDKYYFSHRNTIGIYFHLVSDLNCKTNLPKRDFSLYWKYIKGIWAVITRELRVEIHYGGE